MKKTRRWLEKVHDRRICNEYDNIVPVIADEGDGKSNLMIGLTWWYQQIRGKEPSTSSVLDQLVWDKDEFKDALADWPKKSAIVSMDAARLLNKKKAMNPEQIELEADLFDVRAKLHLMFLGFQEWDTIPSTLQNRRAQHAIYIPRRGVIHGYCRDSLNEKAKTGEWPEPDLVDTFPALETVDGEISDCWAEFQRLDMQKKQERIRASPLEDEDEEKVWTPEEVIHDIIQEGDPREYVKVNEYNPNSINTSLIELDYDLSHRKAKTVKEGLLRQINPNDFERQADETGGAGEGVHT